jgi:3-oxoacid CoA-transferase subunit A
MNDGSMNDSLCTNICEMIKPVKKLVEEAASYIEPEVVEILDRHLTDKRHIEKLLESLLNYAGMSEKADDLFRRLCNYYFFINPVMISEWITIFRNMYVDEPLDDDAELEDDDLFVNPKADIEAISEIKKSTGSKAMTIITGDKHGDFRLVENLTFFSGTTTDDLLIILGDAGINYYGGKKERQFKQLLAKLPLTMFCIQGNHERRPESLGIYQEISFRGGVAYIEPDIPNLLFAKDGEIYDIEGKKCVVIGGAYSVDKEYRLERNWGWWADEQPSEEIKRYVEHRLETEGWRVDVVLSHTAPLKYEPREMFLNFIDDSKVDKSTEIWLDSIEERLTYERWYCAHYHIAKKIDHVQFLYENNKRIG